MPHCEVAEVWARMPQCVCDGKGSGDTKGDRKDLVKGRCEENGPHVMSRERNSAHSCKEKGVL